MREQAILFFFGLNADAKNTAQRFVADGEEISKAAEGDGYQYRNRKRERADVFGEDIKQAEIHCMDYGVHQQTDDGEAVAVAEHVKHDSENG